MGVFRLDANVDDRPKGHETQERHERFTEFRFQFRRRFFRIQISCRCHGRVSRHRQPGRFNAVPSEVTLQIHLNVNLLPKFLGGMGAKQPAQPQQRHEKERQRHPDDGRELGGELRLGRPALGTGGPSCHVSKMRRGGHLNPLFGMNPNNVPLHPPNGVFLR